MDLPSTINLGASLVAIIGTSLTIMQAFSHKPSAFLQDGGVPPPPRYPPQAAWHAPAPQAANGPTFGSSSQAACSAHRHRLRIGLGHRR
jgi:hypothetical protein